MKLCDLINIEKCEAEWGELATDPNTLAIEMVWDKDLGCAKIIERDKSTS